MKRSTDWNLTEAKDAVTAIKEHADIYYKWAVTKDDIEEIISYMEDLSDGDHAFFRIAPKAIKAYDEVLRKRAAHRLWVAQLKREKEKENRNQYAQTKAI
jgi:hypothetical protein